MCKAWFKKVGDRFMGLTRLPCTKSRAADPTWHETDLLRLYHHCELKVNRDACHPPLFSRP